MSNESIRWASESSGSLLEEPPERIKSYGYTTSNSQVDGTPEYPVLQWQNWQFSKTYQAINDLTNLVNAGGGGGGSSGGGSSGGGSSGVNLLINGDFSAGSANWTSTSAADFATVANSDASSGYVATWTPSDPANTLAYSATVSIPIKIQKQVGFISFDFKATTANFAVEVYNGSAKVANYVLPASSEWVAFKKQVGLGAAGDTMSFKFVNTSTDGTEVLTLNNVEFGSDEVSNGAIISEWEEFTPEFNNVTFPSQYVTAKKRRVGENLEVYCVVASAYGATYPSDGSGRIEFVLPDGLTADLVGIGATTQGAALGNVAQIAVSTGANHAFYMNGVSGGRIQFWSLDSSLGNGALTGVNPVDITNDKIRFNFTLVVPIAEWQGQGTMSVLDADKSSPDVAGTIQAWAGTSTVAPAGWAFCDGSTLSIAEYPDLYSAIGDNYNQAWYFPDGATDAVQYSAPPSGYFRVPDTRNLFLRGGNSTQDNTGYSVQGTTAVNGLSTYWTTVGAKSLLNATAFETGDGNAPLVGKSGTRWKVNGSNGTTVGTTMTGDAETAPQHKVVQHIIRLWSNSGSAYGIPIADDDTYGLVKLSDIPSGGSSYANNTTLVPIVTEWTTMSVAPSTFTNLPNATQDYCKWRRVGSTIEINGHFRSSGTVSSSDYVSFYLNPFGVTGVRSDNCGQVLTYKIQPYRPDDADGFATTSCNFYNDQNRIVFYDQGASNSMKLTAVKDGAQFNIKISLEVEEWQGNGTTVAMNPSLVDSNYRFESPQVKSGTVAAGVNGAVACWDSSLPEMDSIGQYYTVPNDGYYRIYACTSIISSSFTGSANISVAIEGGEYLQITPYNFDGVYRPPLSLQTTAHLKKGDKFRVQVKNFTASTITINSDALASVFRVDRIPDYTAGQLPSFGDATADTAGLVKKNKYQTKFMPTNFTLGSGTIPNFQFNNLKSGKVYRLTTKATFQLIAGDTTCYFSARINDSYNIVSIQQANAGGQATASSASDSFIFEVSGDSTLTFTVSSLANTGYISGTGSPSGTYATLEELENYQETTDWT